MLRLRIDPEKPYRAPFICQDGLCCCNMALISFRLFRKNLGNLRDFFEQMVYRPPWQKISRTPMPLKGDSGATIKSLSSQKYLDTLKNIFVERSTQYTSFSSRKQPANAGTERKQFTETSTAHIDACAYKMPSCSPIGV